MSLMNEKTIWETMGNDGYQVEHSLNSLYRKQTGSYYTDLKLTFSMMKEMIDSLSSEKRKTLYKCTFLEPCVGTGNFVFAYLRVCKELGYTTEEYKILLNNIYICDINNTALAVYRKNLTLYAQHLFGIELDDKYFASHIGSGLLIDLDATVMHYIPITEVFPTDVVKDGFDFVVTNPPYKNLKAEKSHYTDADEYERDKAKYSKIKKIAEKLFPNSSAGTINIYKLFVEEIIQRYLAPKGIGYLLIPASILSNKTCSKLRTLLLNTSSLKAVRVISEDSNFVDASQALCAMLFYKGEKTKDISINGSFHGDDESTICIAASDVIDKSADNAILILEKEQYAQRDQMLIHPKIGEISYLKNFRGELDLTLNKDSITSNNTGYQLLRGRNIGYYSLVDTSKKEYVDVGFIEKTPKCKYIKSPRLACQQIVNIAKERRVAFSLVPENYVLGNSCNFISIEQNSDEVDIYFLMGILNSPLINWYFKLTSSNNHINNYEINNFPIPISYKNKKAISNLVRQLLRTNKPALLDEIEILVREAYGLPMLRTETVKTEDESIKGTIFTSKKKLLSLFAHDLGILLPGITYETCSKLLTCELKLDDVLSNTSHTTFDLKVVAGIIKKYTKLANGQILNHTTSKLSDLDMEMIKPVPQGGNWKNIPMETVKKSKRLLKITQTGGRTTLYGRIDYSLPSYTITTYFNRPGNGTYVHPVHNRVLSVREAARFQSFPDSYFFLGNKTDMLKQVGNAVPVLLAYNIGRSIKEKTGCSTSVDLFSGAGGMTYGFKLAGIHAMVANDIVEPACITLKVNNPEIPVICGDITDESIKQQLIKKGIESKADIICGGPPCQGFSMAGWRMKDDPRNQLFRHFVDIVSGVNPKVIVFENVEGILSYQGGKTYQDIIMLFSELGYYTEGRKLMASHYAVPQRRKRVIILCTRKDLGIKPADIFPNEVTPNPNQQISAYETIFDLEKVECSETAMYDSDYTSNILQFFKDEISAEEYIARSMDAKGDTNMDNDLNVDDGSYNTIPLTKSKKMGKKKIEADMQLSLFDFM
jgi:DNA-cytosine methyltransferase|nr:MAG TPA: Cytosine specific methyltransferase [Bacteriophage sp.]